MKVRQRLKFHSFMRLTILLILNYIHLFIFIQSKKIVFLEERNPKVNKINGIIHFINCGKADSILIEQNGRYGLIDACKPYLGATDIVESSSKDAEENPDKSVQAVINYLIHLGITHLDFVLVTHAHIDHIGGIPQIAYHFVDKKTKFLYKKYRVNMEDNEVNFKPAYNSMQAKGAHFITLKKEKYEFDFGNIHLELININYHKKEKKASENHNSIGVILSYKNKRIFLAGDFELENELIYKDQIGKIDMLKLSHHGSSFEFLNTTRPNYTIITNYEIPNDLIIPISILQQIFGGKVYYVGGVSTTTKDVATSAIRLYLSENALDSSEETKDDIETKDSEFNSESNSKAGINTTIVDIEDKDNNQNENTELMNDSDKEEQNFTLDYQEEKVQDGSDNTISEISNETVEWKKEEQVQEKSEIIPENKIDETNLANLVNNAIITNISTENSDEKLQDPEPKNTNSLQETSDWIQWQQIKSTLSLDQILDSELTNNPQFTDSSKAVPTNVSENWGGFGNKKMIWIIACVWLFVLAWIVAVLAFPSKDNKQNTGEGTGTQIIEEYGIDPTHQAPTQPEEEFTWQSTTAPHAGNPTIQQDFPEAESEDEPEDEWNTISEEQDTWEPAPYTCEWDECLEEPVITKEEDNKLDVESIEPVISRFKSQAEGYYSIWDERQDKKLIRYAAQAISLCESYQEQINNWEWIDEESFSSFKSKVKTIISKMEEYLGWDNDVQTFTKSNFDEEYDFPWKDEHKQYIYEINS